MCRRFTCNVCDLMNEVPVDYYAGIDMATGRRTDEAQRPELSFGSVEYVAPTEYMVRDSHSNSNSNSNRVVSHIIRCQSKRRTDEAQRRAVFRLRPRHCAHRVPGEGCVSYHVVICMKTIQACGARTRRSVRSCPLGLIVIFYYVIKRSFSLTNILLYSYLSNF